MKRFVYDVGCALIKIGGALCDWSGLDGISPEDAVEFEEDHEEIELYVDEGHLAPDDWVLPPGVVEPAESENPSGSIH